MRDLFDRPERESRESRRDRREAGRHEWAASLWRDTARRLEFGPCARDTDADVVIVGAGFTGLWTAYHTKMLNPQCEVVVLEARQPGFGASGRNGGWCSALYPLEFDEVSRAHGRAAATALAAELRATVDTIGQFISSRNIDAGWVKSGSLTVATNPAQAERLRFGLTRRNEFPDSRATWLEPDELAPRINIHGALGALHDPDCAALQPQALLDGLLTEVLALGVRVFGQTRVTRIGRDHVDSQSPAGFSTVTGRHIVVATEAWSSRLPRRRRSLVPLYSYVIATEPLGNDVWSRIGWSRRETLAEGRNMVTYAQRTADNRIVFGGRGAPYAFGSDIHASRDVHSRVHRAIESTMHELLPATSGARITHRWGGPLGVPRDWEPSVTMDPSTGALHVGGYVGDGVSMAHLAGRIAAHRITAVDDAVLTLPLNDRSVRKWEPEPFRWVGINTGLATTALADLHERRTGRSSRILQRLMGLF